MPALWTDTVESHRREVRDAVLDAAWTLVRERGLLAVTMSDIAATAGIGRATLYKYFPDVTSVLSAWHERQISGHLTQLTELGSGHGDRLREVLSGVADIARHSSGHDLGLEAVLRRGHQSQHGVGARDHLHRMIAGLIAEGVGRGDLRGDVPPEELSTYCLSALAAAAGLPSETAVRRLVDVTMAGLRPSPSSGGGRGD
jgi:AcrR family transcriptional regulator